MSEPWHDVSKHLGNSMAWEEHKGDFRQASQVARHWLLDAERSGLPEQQAKALLAHAAVEGLRGELITSEQFLDQAEALSEDPSLRLHIASLRLLFYRYKLLLFPDGSGYPTSDLAELWSPAQDSTLLRQAQHLRAGKVGEAAGREALFLHQVLSKPSDFVR